MISFIKIKRELLYSKLLTLIYEGDNLLKRTIFDLKHWKILDIKFEDLVIEVNTMSDETLVILLI